MFALDIILFPAVEIPVENIIQSVSAEYVKSGCGRDSEGIFKALPANEKMLISSNGCSMAQRKPRTVCLYFTLISRQAKKNNISLYSQISFKPRLSFWCGLISYSTGQIYVFMPFINLMLGKFTYLHLKNLFGITLILIYHYEKNSFSADCFLPVSGLYKQSGQ